MPPEQAPISASRAAPIQRADGPRDPNKRSEVSRPIVSFIIPPKPKLYRGSSVKLSRRRRHLRYGVMSSVRAPA